MLDTSQSEHFYSLPQQTILNRTLTPESLEITQPFQDEGRHCVNDDQRGGR